MRIIPCCRLRVALLFHTRASTTASIISCIQYYLLLDCPKHSNAHRVVFYCATALYSRTSRSSSKMAAETAGIWNKKYGAEEYVRGCCAFIRDRSVHLLIYASGLRNGSKRLLSVCGGGQKCWQGFLRRRRRRS
jgi:hypothetical protein